MQSLQKYLSEALVKYKITNYRNDNDVVDFGLSVKWLKYNLAGDKLTDDESDYGYYYQWGSTVGYPDATTHVFDWTTCPYCNGSRNSFTKYVINSKYGTVDNKTTLEPMDDAVTALLGSDYRMPTADEYIELCDHCGGIHSGSLYGTYSYLKSGIYWVVAGTTVDGVKYTNHGYLFVGQDVTKHVFFPAAGSSVHNVGYHGNGAYYGNYWSSTLSLGDSYYAYGLHYENGVVHPTDYYYRSDAFSIRGVKVK